MFQLVVDAETGLELLEEQHAAELFALVDRNRESLREWLPWLDQNTSADQTRAFIRASLQQHANRNGFACGVRHRGALAGVIGLHAIDWPNRSTGLGYWLDGAQRGRGLVTKSCAVLIDHLFGELGLHRVVVECAVGNVRSCAIPERLGFSREGVLRQREWLYDHFVDHVLYAMVSTEWSERRPK
jgi:ribosomal-protein-serine acetyltransferase